jgi:ketosteroid isomerase-like protein
MDKPGRGDVVGFISEMLKTAAAGDYDKLKSFYVDDAKLWLNTTRTWRTLQEHFQLSSGMRSKLTDARYDDARITPFDDGCVAQFQFRAKRSDGTKIDLPVCIVIRMHNGKIVQREEYFDSAGLAAAPAN